MGILGKWWENIFLKKVKKRLDRVFYPLFYCSKIFFRAGLLISKSPYNPVAFAL